MPIDPTLLPALRKELEYAEHVAPGGQVTDPGRLAAIKTQIKLHEAAAKKADSPDENASNVPTDYESHDKDADEKQPERAERVAKAKDAHKRETAVASEDKSDVETTDG